MSPAISKDMPGLKDRPGPGGMPLKVLHQEPGGQVKLVAFQDRFNQVMTRHFGRRFQDYRDAWAASSRFELTPTFPLSLDLEVNASCNFRCLMCPMGEAFPGNDVPYGALMDMSFYRRLMEQAKEHGLPAMTFGYLSEPLLHPDLPGMIRLARQAGVMDIRLGVNGSLLSEPMARQIIDAGLTRLEVSLDAHDPDTFRRIRRGGRLEDVVDHILKFLEIRTQSGSDFPLLRLSFLRLPYNESEIEPFMAFWKEKADLFSIQEPLYYREAPIAKMLTLALGTVDPGFRCAQPWQRLIVRADGSAYPCCSLYGLALKLGSARKTSLKDLWDLDAMDLLRREHALGRYQDRAACLRCAESYAVRPVSLPAGPETNPETSHV